MNHGDYARAWALVLHTTLIKGIEASFPTLPIAEQDDILLDILNRLALRLGWTIRRNSIDAEDDG